MCNPVPCSAPEINRATGDGSQNSGLLERPFRNLAKSVRMKTHRQSQSDVPRRKDGRDGEGRGRAVLWCKRGRKSLSDYRCLALLGIIILAPRTANVVSSFKCALIYLSVKLSLDSWALLTADSDGDINTPVSMKGWQLIPGVCGKVDVSISYLQNWVYRKLTPGFPIHHKMTNK